MLDPAGHRWMIERDPAAGPRPGDLVYASLWTPDADAATAFYGDVLGWPSGAAHGSRGRLGIWPTTGRPTLLPCWAVPDVDDAVALVRAAGGTAREPSDEPYGRVADCVDDQDLPFALCAPAGAAEAPGELAYYEMRVPDPGRARAFYSTVLGWRYRPGTDPDYWHPLTDGGWPTPSSGLTTGEATVVPWLRVRDLEAAVAAVRVTGGRAGEPEPGREGLVVACADDQGTPFCLVQ